LCPTWKGSVPEAVRWQNAETNVSTILLSWFPEESLSPGLALSLGPVSEGMRVVQAPAGSFCPLSSCSSLLSKRLPLTPRQSSQTVGQQSMCGQLLNHLPGLAGTRLSSSHFLASLTAPFHQDGAFLGEKYLVRAHLPPSSCPQGVQHRCVGELEEMGRKCF
jgi:hypothetical protein